MGMAILGLVQQMESGHAAGLESFIYGKTASMIASDAWLIGVSGLVCVAVATLFLKELKLLCFDEGFGASRGYSMLFLDTLLMALVVIVSIVGLQAVGLILMIALLVIPAASARFWTDEMRSLAIYSALLGALSSALGATASALFPRLPSGAMIVLVASSMFLFSMIVGSRRGILIRWLRRRSLNARIDRQHLLRAMFELAESSSKEDAKVSWRDLLKHRSWSALRLKSAIAVADKIGLVRQVDAHTYALTQAGVIEASRLVREHRLWEIYLINYAESAPSRVDRDADAIEHVLEPVLIAELERALADQVGIHSPVPPDPHGNVDDQAEQVSVKSARTLLAQENR
jgi:manganese/zinc/iron transport system permease protein